MNAVTTMSGGAKIAFTIFVLGFVLNYIETAYFGWHWNAGVVSEAERRWDLISTSMIFLGLAGQIYYRNWGGG